MTAQSTPALSQPIRRPGRASARAPAKPALRERLMPLLYRRWFQLPMVLGIGLTLFYDRYLLCKQYLFRYTDEDQAIMWYAAHELLHGRLHEPCFFGQDYNSCLEGYLAVPLIALHVPYGVAVPLVTVILGLLPFLLMALVAWKRGHALVAATALLVPLLLPVRYSIITGIPRGFVAGIALAIIPTILLLPPAPRRRRATADGQEPLLAPRRQPRWLSRTWPALRYFFAAVVAVVAIQINPNCLILLVPVAVYALLTSWREWRFWVCGSAGLIAAAPYPLYVYQFYYVYHPDYPAYLRGVNYAWAYSLYNVFLNQFVAPRNGANSPVLMDLVPLPISGGDAPSFLAAAFATVTGMLLIRRRSAGVAAALAGAAFTFITFAYERVRTYNGNNSASFPYCRMYLALPVVFVWLLFLVNHTPWTRFANTPFSRWITRGALLGMLLAAFHVFNVKQEQIDPPNDDVPGISPNSVLYPELRNSVVCQPIPVDQLYAIGREVQRTAEAQKADLLIVGGAGDKWIAYAIPALANIETLYLGQQSFERRTWRFIEENRIRRNNVLLIAFNAGGLIVGGNTSVWVDGDGNPVDPAAMAAPPQPQPVNPGRGGMGGFGGGRGGGGARGGGPGGGPGGGGGRGFGRGRGISTDPTQQGVNHVVEIPALALYNLGGHTLYESGAFQLPRLISPPATPANPTPGLQVYRPNWSGR